ncbi:hypothetical protein SPHINGO361_120694 [Sphingomonas sp. EC-HK361]|nr:hypothetical protein SPHINGO361_120694 [Sphingomonas sp. EC-HK361]
MREAAVRKAALLRERDQLFDIRAEFLRLGDGGRDLLMLDERCRHVAEQRDAVGRGPLKLTAANTVTHDLSFSFVRGPFHGTPRQVGTVADLVYRHPGEGRDPCLYRLDTTRE